MKYLIKLLSLFFSPFLLFPACQNDASVKTSPSIHISLKAGILSGTETSNRQLTFTICLFQAPLISGIELADSNFRCTEISTGLTEKEVGNYSFKVSHADKGVYAYRLFVHATPGGSNRAETTVQISKDERFDQLEIRLIKENGGYASLSEDNYYDYQSLSESNLSGTTVIHLELKRLVGRLVFDIFKSDDNLNPVDIDPGFGSVLDRVKQIEVSVKGMTTSFRPSGNTATKNKEACAGLQIETKLDNAYQLHISDQNPSYFSVVEKKDDAGLNLQPAGGARFFSLYLLPTGTGGEELLDAELTFCYQDEYAENTPSEMKKLTLQLPSGNSGCLKVAENCYTLTNIRLKNNRIIDLSTSGKIEIDTAWNK